MATLRTAPLDEQARTDATKAANAAHAAKSVQINPRLPAGTVVPAAPVAAAPVAAAPVAAAPVAAAQVPAQVAAIPASPSFPSADGTLVKPMSNLARVSASPAEQAARSAAIATMPLTQRAALAKSELPPVDPSRSNTFDGFGKYGTSATAPTVVQKPALDFKTAGFPNQAEYDATIAKNTPMAPALPNTTSRLPSDSWTAAQDAGNIQAAQIRANTPAPMARAAAYELGNIHRSDSMERLGQDETRRNRIKGQMDDAAAYQKQNPATRASNIDDARRNGTFEKTRDEYNKTNKATHLMDETGEIREYDAATRQKMLASSAAVKLSESKAATTEAGAIYQFQNRLLKDLVGAQKAADAAKAKSPSGVSENIAGLFGVTPKPFMMGGSVTAAPKTDNLAPIVQAPDRLAAITKAKGASALAARLNTPHSVLKDLWDGAFRDRGPVKTRLP